MNYHIDGELISFKILNENEELMTNFYINKRGDRLLSVDDQGLHLFDLFTFDVYAYMDRQNMNRQLQLMLSNYAIQQQSQWIQMNIVLSLVVLMVLS